MKNGLAESDQMTNFLVPIICLICMLSSAWVSSQTLFVQGKVTSNRWPVKQALVTFIDESDTTKKFTALTDDAGFYQVGLPTAICGENKDIPADFELAQNYPNPFSSSTSIPYSIKRQSDVKVTIYDILGRELRRYKVGMQTTGYHNIYWNGQNSSGQTVANGIYFYRLQAGGKSLVKKMILNSGSENLFPIQPGEFPLNSIAEQRIDELSETIYYTIRVENSDKTIPVINFKQIELIAVEHDTTIDLVVDHLLTVSVDPDSVRQYIRGFGASNIVLWRPDMTDSEIQTAFGTGNGQLGFSILRIMLEPDKTRWSRYLPSAKKAYDMGVTIIAAPWYAPAEMVETVNGVSRVRHDMFDEYAAHLDSFSTYMKNNGVPVYGISVQNEPDITDQWTSWTSAEMFTFMKNHAHAVTGTIVMAPESFHFNRDYSDPILNDSAACANTDIICGHIYGSGLGSYPLAEGKGKEIWMTEHLSGENNSANDWEWALAAGKEMNDVMQSGMSAYVWWYIVRYYGPIDDGEWDVRYKKGTVTKKGYVMSQFSRYIRPGDYRVDSAIYPYYAQVYVSAYTDSMSAKTVIVAINQSTSPVEVAFYIRDRTVNSVTPYTTSATKNVVQGSEIYLSTERFSFNMEASSITTFVSN